MSQTRFFTEKDSETGGTWAEPEETGGWGGDGKTAALQDQENAYDDLSGR